VQDSTILTNQAITLAGSVESLLAGLERTSATMRDTVSVIDDAFIKPGRDKPPDPQARPFDIAEYARTAEAVTATLQRASTLLAEVRTTLDSQPLAASLHGAIDTSIEKAATQSTRLVDTVFWRAAALLVLAFVLALLYRFAVLGISRPRPPG
jgi:hypothetical protein